MDETIMQSLKEEGKDYRIIVDVSVWKDNYIIKTAEERDELF